MFCVACTWPFQKICLACFCSSHAQSSPQLVQGLDHGPFFLSRQSHSRYRAIIPSLLPSPLLARSDCKDEKGGGAIIVLEAERYSIQRFYAVDWPSGFTSPAVFIERLAGLRYPQR